MKNINVIKSGNIVNISIDGKLSTKNCGTTMEANELFKMVLKAKEDPSDQNILDIRCYLNEKTRVALVAGLESDPETGEIYMAGFNTPIPDTLVDVIKDYHENNFPMDAIVNFWSLLMLNPDNRVRTDLFDFITTHDFVLTDKGYMVVYKAVNDVTANTEATAFAEFVNSQYLHVKKDWKTGANKYVVYRDIENDTWEITKKKTANKWDEKEKGVEILGKLGELYNSLFNVQNTEEDDATPTFESMTNLGPKMTIKLGEAVQQDRKDCDADYRVDCSNGLHVGASRYVETFGSGRDKRVLVYYVNPANVVAVPQYDHSKMRVCEYFPFAIAEYENGKIDVIEQAYFESDYSEIEAEELAKQVELIQANELPIETAMKAEAEMRPMSELLKIIENRLVDIQ